ncbi:MAG: hypothetical protein ACTSRA_11730 [Promethearchaeota archaeon]
MSEEERLLRYLKLEDQLETLYLINSYYLFRNLQKEEWKIDWKTFVLLFTCVEKPLSHSEILRNWSVFRHHKEISQRLPPLLKFKLITEQAGPKNAKLLYTTQKGRYVSAFFFYLITFKTKNIPQFKFLEEKFVQLPGFNTTDDLFASLKLLKNQIPALVRYVPEISKALSELNWKIDYKLILIPLYLLDGEEQTYTDLINNYPHFGYYRELKKRVVPLVDLNLLTEEKAGRRGSFLKLTRKGKYLLIFLAYLMSFPNFPAGL